jgi:tellurite resistance protein TehA-like permease
MEGVDERDYQRAKKRVHAIRGFWGHFTTYILVNIVLFIIDLVNNPGEWWFYWALGGWGILIILHAISVFVVGRLRGKKWEEAKIKEVLEKEKE